MTAEQDPGKEPLAVGPRRTGLAVLKWGLLVALAVSFVDTVNLVIFATGAPEDGRQVLDWWLALALVADIGLAVSGVLVAVGALVSARRGLKGRTWLIGAATLLLLGAALFLVQVILFQTGFIFDIDPQLTAFSTVVGVTETVRFAAAMAGLGFLLAGFASMPGCVRWAIVSGLVFIGAKVALAAADFTLNRPPVSTAGLLTAGHIALSVGIAAVLLVLVGRVRR